MSTDSKPPVPAPSTPPPIKHREKGIRIFTWPKMIYIFPSAIVALICAIGMWSLKEKQYDLMEVDAGRHRARDGHG